MTGWSTAAFVTGLAIVTALGVVDMAVTLSFLGAFLVGVLVAAVAASPLQVAVVGGYALVWAAALGFDGDYWTGAHWLRISVLVVGSAVAVAATVLRERYIAALIRTANVAEVAQRALLRPLDEKYDDIELAVRYVSASDGALIGGDVYAAEVTPWGLRVLVADVCGQGLEAVDKASSLVVAFRAASHSSETLSELAFALEESFARHIEGSVDFATGVLLQISDGHVEIVNSGHPDPVLVRSGRATWVSPDRRSRPFGLRPVPQPMRLVLLAEDRLVVYTDGVTEARDSDGAFFDLETRTAALGAGSLEDALDTLLAEVADHTGSEFRDDIVLLGMHAP